MMVSGSVFESLSAFPSVSAADGKLRPMRQMLLFGSFYSERSICVVVEAVCFNSTQLITQGPSSSSFGKWKERSTLQSMNTRPRRRKEKERKQQARNHRATDYPTHRPTFSTSGACALHRIHSFRSLNARGLWKGRTCIAYAPTPVAGKKSRPMFFASRDEEKSHQAHFVYWRCDIGRYAGLIDWTCKRWGFGMQGLCLKKKPQTTSNTRSTR